MRLVFFGTPDYAVPSLQRLLDGPHEVVASVSQPDRPRGRGRKTVPAPVAECAIAHDVPALRPAKVGDPEVVEQLRALEPELGVVVAFGQFMPKKIRELPTLGYCINGHASLLPRWRGAAPIQRALLAGDTETGVCVMRVEREMDAGAVAKRGVLRIGEDEDAGSLSARMAELTATLLAETVDEIAAGRVTWTEQPEIGVTLAPKLERAESVLDLREPAEALVRRVRAFAPEPGARVSLGGEPLRILAARAEPGDTPPPGTARADKEQLRIATGEGWLVPSLLQRPGKRPVATDAFLRGRAIESGTRFDLPDEA